MNAPLTCARCGAPLPLPRGPYVSCSFCGASATVGAPMGPVIPPDPARGIATIDAFKAAMARGGSPYDALTSAARENLGPLGETDTLARIVLALGKDFDAQHGTSVTRDAMTMTRLINGYLVAIEGIRATGSHRLHMPFFAVTPQGPIAFDRTLTAATVAELSHRAP